MTQTTAADRIRKRDSNVELLRIIAMIMIVAHHLMLHGGVFEHASQTASLLFGGLLIPGGKIGFVCFIVISAWYGAQKEFSGKRYMKIALEAVFYNMLGMFLATLLNRGTIEPITARNWLGALLPVFGSSHGFVVYYLIYLLILPLLQKASAHMTQKNILAMLALLFMMQVGGKVISVVIGYSPLVDLNSDLLVFIAIYFMIVCLQRRPVKLLEKKALLLAVLAAVWAIDFAFNLLMHARPDSEMLSKASLLVNSETSPLNIAAGFSLFFLFKNMRIGHSRLINTIASHTFGVLLLHDHNYFRYVIWGNVFSVEKIYGAGLPMLAGYTVAVTALIFVAGVLVDMLREKCLEKPLEGTRLYASLCSGLETYFKL